MSLNERLTTAQVLIDAAFERFPLPLTNHISFPFSNIGERKRPLGSINLSMVGVSLRQIQFMFK